MKTEGEILQEIVALERICEDPGHVRLHAMTQTRVCELRHILEALRWVLK